MRTVKYVRKLLTWEVKRINRASQDYLAKGLRGFGSRFGDKCLESEIQREAAGSSPLQRLRPRLSWNLALRTRKTIYFEGRKLHYQAERAQSIMTFSKFAAARQRRAIASSMMIPGLVSFSVAGGTIIVVDKGYVTSSVGHRRRKTVSWNICRSWLDFFHLFLAPHQKLIEIFWRDYRYLKKS